MVSPYLSAIIEQDKAPVIVIDYGGFFVSGVQVRAFLGQAPIKYSLHFDQTPVRSQRSDHPKCMRL